jgi:two-component system chemotaxis response regulator CheB
MAALRSDVAQPIVITQHMPPTFTTILAEHITRHSGVSCSEAKHGEVLQDRHAYVAPGDYHMTFKQRGAATMIQLSQSPLENFCRPAVDPMLRSLVSIYGGAVMATILTGMGYDGLRGCELVRGAGGTVLAQDESTSVVWGMPGAVAQAGLAEAVLPLKQIGPAMRRIALRTAP